MHSIVIFHRSQAFFSYSASELLLRRWQLFVWRWSCTSFKTIQQNKIFGFMLFASWLNSSSPDSYANISFQPIQIDRRREKRPIRIDRPINCKSSFAIDHEQKWSSSRCRPFVFNKTWTKWDIDLYVYLVNDFGILMWKSFVRCHWSDFAAIAASSQNYHWVYLPVSTRNMRWEERDDAWFIVNWQSFRNNECHPSELLCKPFEWRCWQSVLPYAHKHRHTPNTIPVNMLLYLSTLSLSSIEPRFPTELSKE